MAKMSTLRQEVMRVMPYGRRFTAYDLARAAGNVGAKQKVAMMLAQMANARKAPAVIRDGVGVYHRAPTVGPHAAPVALTFKFQRVFNTVSWDEGCISAASLVKQNVVRSRNYASIVLMHLADQGKIVRVKHGHYALKGSSFDRSTPKRGPAIDPFS